MATIIRAELVRHGYEPVESQEAKTTCIVGTSRRRWWQVLLRAIPQRIVCHINAVEGGSTIGVTTRWAPWYAVVSIAVSCVSLGMWYWSIRALFSLDKEQAPTATWQVTMFVISFCAVIVAFRTVMASGASIVSALCRELEQIVHEHAFRFERTGSGGMLPGTRWAGAYIVAMVLLASLALSQSGFSIAEPFLIVVLAIASAAGVSMISVMVISLRHPGASERCEPALPGLWLIMSYLFLLFAAFPAVLVGRKTVEDWTRAVERMDYALLVLLLLMIVGIITISIGLLIQAVRICDLIEKGDAHVKLRPSSTHSTNVMKGQEYLGAMRIALVAVWVASSIALAGMLGHIVLNFVPVLFGNAANGPLVATGWFIAAIAGREPDDPTAHTAAGVCWIVLTLAASLPFVILIGDQLRSTWSLRCSVRAVRSKGSVLSDAPAEMLLDLARMARTRPPQLVLVDGVIAAATVVGLGARNRLIVLGNECVESLEPNELRALIAHEFAHHLHGDCMRCAVLRLLGRITLVGDGFVAVIADSFGYESRADQTAVMELGIDPDHLGSCLKKMSMLAAMDRTMQTVGLSLQPSTDTNERRRGRWRDIVVQRIRLFWVCYAGGGRIGYWHPSTADRIARLETMAARSNEIGDK